MRYTTTVGFLMLSMCTCGQSFLPFQDEAINEIMMPTTFFGCGLSCYDVNDDGYDDLTIGGKNTSLRLFLNNNGSFTEHDLGLSFTGEVKSVLWADIDNDGDADLFVSVYNQFVKLYENIGNLELVDISSSAGIPVEATENWGAAWGDVNADGFLDLYLCKYANHNIGQATYNRMNHLFLNNGNNTFTDITMITEVQDGIKLSFLPLFWDYDKDGDQDIYVINDKTYRNTVFRNDGDLTFTDAGLITGLAVVMDAMSASPGDWDHDGHDDIYVTNTYDGNALFSRSNTAVYTDIAPDHGMGIFQECWSANWLDHDNDGNLDLYACSSGGGNGGNPNVLFVQENGTFSATSLSDQYEDSPWTHASGIFDLNNDGFTDIANSNFQPYGFSIWQNTPNDNNYLKLDLTGSLSNKDGIGTHIDLYSCDQYQYRYTHCGEAYITQNSQYEIFGLGSCSIIDSLILTWLSGTREVYYNLNVNQFYHLTEGQSFSLSSNLVPGLHQTCADSVYQVCVDGFPDVIWSDGSELHCRELYPGNNYTVHGLFNNAMIDSLSFQIELSNISTPAVLLHEPLCNGENSGALEVLDNFDISTVLWSNGSMDLLNDSIFSGWYSLHTENDLGCGYDTLIFLSEPPELQLGSIIAQPSEFEPGSAIIAASGGTPPYSISWNNGSSSWILYDLNPGPYSLIVADNNACELSMNFVINSITSSLEHKDQNLLYPNPTADFLMLDNLSPIAQKALKCYDLNGRELSAMMIFNGQKLELSNFSAGIYIFLWREGANSFKQTIVVE